MDDPILTWLYPIAAEFANEPNIGPTVQSLIARRERELNPIRAQILADAAIAEEVVDKARGA